MSWKNNSLIHVMILVFVLGILLLSGCKRAGAETNTGEAPTEASQQSPAATLTTSSITIAPGNVYPSPNTDTPAAPTQAAGPYPPPTSATIPQANATLPPTIRPGENSQPNPYPIQETPLQEQASSTNNPSPYPPPVETGPSITVTSVPPSADRIAPTPTVAFTPGATPAVTPKATIVKTEMLATDPVTVNLEAGRPQLVVFFADWCTLCKSVAPVVLSLESQYNNTMNFIYLDVDDKETKSLQQKLNYTLIGKPRIFLIDPQGAVLRDWTGYVLFEELQQAINLVVPVSP